MIRSLDIQNILIIECLELEFSAGLNVLTGETGAGKSILLDSLGFVLGWRGRADLVREGADKGEVTAVFDVPPSSTARDLLDEAGIDCDDGELILRRVNYRDGRKVAWINGVRASGELLRQLSQYLIELHGQHDDRGLLNAKNHLDLLDEFGALHGDVKILRKAWAKRREIETQLKKSEQQQAALKEEEEFIQHTVDELSKLSAELGEEAQLDKQRRLMQSAEKIASDVSKASYALSGDGAEGMIADSLRWLEGASAHAEGRLESAIEALSRALHELSEAQSEVSSCIDELKFNPHDLEECEERLFEIRGMARKHNLQPDELPKFLENYQNKLASLEASTSDLSALQDDLQKAQSHYLELAQNLSVKREKAGRRLDVLICEELAPLKMERAVFTTHITQSKQGPDGQDDVAFTVATNPGAPSGPLGKIASGGELSRFLLALKVCLSKAQSGITLIFDEIDRGVGGATADAVGRRLKRLAEGGQVLVVTHSPQVAALGAHHLRVAKRVENDVTISEVEQLTGDERIDEIARMLSGDRITQAAREAAKALMLN